MADKKKADSTTCSFQLLLHCGRERSRVAKKSFPIKAVMNCKDWLPSPSPQFGRKCLARRDRAVCPENGPPRQHPP